MKTSLFLAVCCGLVSFSMARAQDAAPTVTGAESTAQLPNQAAPAFSGRVNDVVTLVQSGVDQSVVLSYIKTSPGPFAPDASEIVKIRDAGVSPTVITAMLERGNELRQQEPQSQPTQVATGTTYTQPPVQQVVVAATPSYVQPVYVQPEPVSTVVYIGGGASPAYQRLSPYWSFPRPVYSYNTYHYGFSVCAPRVVHYGGWHRGGWR